MKCRELPAACFIDNFFFAIIYPSHPPFEFVLSLAQASHVGIQFARLLALTRSRPISVLYLLSKGSLPEDIKSNEGASLTIC